MKPTVGRIVHYLNDPNGAAEAALITNVLSDECVNLVVWNANGTPSTRYSVLLGTEPGKWMWPPKV